jgi:membrane protease YdiL (CAAX protease family)
VKLVAIRLVLLFAAAALTAGLLSFFTGSGFSLALTPQLSALYFIPVNLVCLWLLRRELHARGSSLRELAGFDRTKLGRDALQGLLWLMVLFAPFIIAVNLGMLLLFGPEDMLAAFAVVFAPDPSQTLELAPWFTMVSAIITALLFPVSNAPTEELLYRGHAQGALIRAGWPTWLGVAVPALAFGAQHVLLAPSAAGMFVYALAFLGWGAGAGILRLRQRRLMPLIIAHFLTNAMFAVVPLVFVFTGLPAG